MRVVALIIHTGQMVPLADWLRVMAALAAGMYRFFRKTRWPDQQGDHLCAGRLKMVEFPVAAKQIRPRNTP
jgi:hypothetical protein